MSEEGGEKNPLTKSKRRKISWNPPEINGEQAFNRIGKELKFCHVHNFINYYKKPSDHFQSTALIKRNCLAMVENLIFMCKQKKS